MQYKRVTAVDTETALFGRGEDLAPRIACMTYCDSEDAVPGIATGDDILRVFRAIASQDTTIVGVNFAFDAHVLLRYAPELTEELIALYDANRVLDLSLNERLIDIARGCLDGSFDADGKYVKRYYSLAAMFDGYGHGSLDKSGDTYRTRYGELIGTPESQWPEAARKYALDDAAATLRVHQSQLQHEHFWRDDAAAQARGAFALRKTAIRGMVTDGPTVEAYIVELKQLIKEASDQLLKAELVRPNGSKNTKLAKQHMLAVCAQHGVEPKITDTAKKQKLSLQAAIDGGYISLDAEAIRDAGPDPLLKAYGIYTTADTLLTRAELLLEGSKGLPLQTDFQPLLENGRVSSRIPSPPIVGAQIQNMPRSGKLRECFVPRPGYYYCSIDYNSDEIVTFAQVQLWLTGKSKLADALRSGLDVHSYLAADVLGEPYEVVVKNKKHGKYKDARQLAKIANFGLLGGMSARTFRVNANKRAKSKEERITLADAERVRDAWYRTWDTSGYFDAVKSAIGRDGYHNVCVMRSFKSGRIRGGLSFTEAANNAFSSLAADSNKDALYQVVRAGMLAKPGSPFFDTHVVAPLHDELLLEVPISTATASAKAVCQLMLDTKNKWMTDVASSAEPCLMTRWLKDAEAVWTPDGELLPWAPPPPTAEKAA